MAIASNVVPFTIFGSYCDEGQMTSVPLIPAGESCVIEAKVLINNSLSFFQHQLHLFGGFSYWPTYNLTEDPFPDGVSERYYFPYIYVKMIINNFDWSFYYKVNINDSWILLTGGEKLISLYSSCLFVQISSFYGFTIVLQEASISTIIIPPEEPPPFAYQTYRALLSVLWTPAE
jgi:hypothetical protein